MDFDKYKRQYIYLTVLTHTYIVVNRRRYQHKIVLLTEEDIIMNIYGKSDLEILREIARRLKRRRLNLNMPQQELADRTGLNRATISGIEQGKPFGVMTLIQILRALDALEDLGSFVPDPGIRARSSWSLFSAV